MKVRYMVAFLAVASVVLMGAVGTGGADEWFLLSEQTIKATDPSVRITAEAGKWIKEDVKDVRLSVEGADVEISKVVLHWKNRKDETLGLGRVDRVPRQPPFDNAASPLGAPGRSGSSRSTSRNLGA